MPELDQRAVFALLLTLAAGMSTGIGSVLGLFNRSFNPRVLALALSFSAGVMIQVSFVEIFPKARAALAESLGVQLGYAVTVAAFFGGIAAMALLEQLRLAGHPLHEPPCGTPWNQADMPMAMPPKMPTAIIMGKLVGVLITASLMLFIRIMP